MFSAFRICLVPVFVYAYFSQTGDVKIFAVIIYFVAGVTDFLDGFIARRLNVTSNLGKILDPLGDKLMMVSVMTCITIDGIIPVWAVAAAFGKELIMGVGGLLLHSRAGEIPPSNIFGKTSTVVFLVVCIVLMVFRDIPSKWATVMIAVAIALMFVALVSYIATYAKAIKADEQK
jgi:CDP-diacylglycerol--glycerol-3-phosphate 3-phosphatidyltransferase